jgi:hypothetical protein
MDVIMLTEKYKKLEELEKVIEFTYPGISLLIRDSNLGNLGLKYQVGMILKELGFTDASLRRGGMVTTHRLVILSNHYANMKAYEHDTHWGLCVLEAGSYFKVLDTWTQVDKTQIILLHLPEKGWEVFDSVATDMDQELVKIIRAGFEHCLELPPVPELTTQTWLNRCHYPIGMSEDGEYFPLNTD